VNQRRWSVPLGGIKSCLVQVCLEVQPERVGCTGWVSWEESSNPNTLCLKKTALFYFCNNIVDPGLIWIIFGNDTPEENCNKICIVFPTTPIFCTPTVPCDTGQWPCRWLIAVYQTTLQSVVASDHPYYVSVSDTLPPAWYPKPCNPLENSLATYLPKIIQIVPGSTKLLQK